MVAAWGHIPGIDRLFFFRIRQAGSLNDSASIDPSGAPTSSTTGLAGRRAHGATRATRWSDRRDDPIRVWIQDTSALAEWRPEDRTIVAAAFRTWTGVGVPVRFVFVKSATGADVVVRWIGQFASQYDGWTTTWWDQDGWITHGEMTLAVRTPAGRALTPAELKAIATHEAGHVLGLAHATDAGALMAATVRTTHLTAADSVAVRQLYDGPPGAGLGEALVDESGR